MYSKKQFRALEAMCREQAALARNEKEYSLMEYWLAEAEEWKQFRQSDPFKERISNRSSDPAKSSTTGRMIGDSEALARVHSDEV
jgi:hypothetical protein